MALHSYAGNSSFVLHEAVVRRSSQNDREGKKHLNSILGFKENEKKLVKQKTKQTKIGSRLIIINSDFDLREENSDQLTATDAAIVAVGTRYTLNSS